LRHAIRTMALLLALLSASGIGAPVLAANVTATVNASVSKPLEIAMLQSLDFGTITLGTGAWSNATVSLSQAGVLSCANANIICTGATQVAKYNVQGSNGATVRISAPNVTMVNQSAPSSTLLLTTSAPPSIVPPNSGKPGIDFSIGGSITLDSTTVPGTYVGTFNVTVDY
jgi:hypothetical protein